MRTHLLLIYFFRVCLCLYDTWDDEDVVFDMKDEMQYGAEVINGTLRNVVKKYYCFVEDVTGERTILYGTKAWTFPRQDVNLTLTYPPANLEHRHEDKELMITRVTVLLYIDGAESRGYITKGGMFKNRISMTFIISNITRISYQFWLYGVHEPYMNISELSWKQSLC